MTSVGFIVRDIKDGGGVKMVVKNLLTQINLLISEERSIEFIVYSDQEYNFLKDLNNIEVKTIKKCNKLLWDNYFLYRRLKRDSVSCAIYPKSAIPPSNFFLRCKKMIIVHDLAHFEKGLNAYKFWDVVYMKAVVGLSCIKSARIFSISNYTKKDIIKRFDVSEDKITVILEAAKKSFRVIGNEDELRRIKKKYNLKQPFMFYSGSISPRKNILRVLKAFNQIKNKVPHNFYFTGSGGWNNEDIWEFIRQNKLKDRVIKIGYVEESELPILFNLANLSLYPSLYEGFGLPILEAQACGCSVLTSNVSSLPEVAGKGAHIVDPYSSEEIKNGMMKIIEDETYRNKLIEEGFKNIKRFSWNDSAKKIINGIIPRENEHKG